MARKGRPPKDPGEAAERTLRDKRAQAKHQASADITAILAPVRNALRLRLEAMSAAVIEDAEKATAIATQVELASIARGLAIVSTIETLDLTPPGNKPFAVRQLHEVTEKMGGSDAAFSEIIFNLNIQVAE